MAEIPNIFGPGYTAQMTYYETAAGARVFAAGALDFGGAVMHWPSGLYYARLARNAGVGFALFVIRRRAARRERVDRARCRLNIAGVQLPLTPTEDGLGDTGTRAADGGAVASPGRPWRAACRPVPYAYDLARYVSWLERTGKERRRARECPSAGYRRDARAPSAPSRAHRVRDRPRTTSVERYRSSAALMFLSANNFLEGRRTGIGLRGRDVRDLPVVGLMTTSVIRRTPTARGARVAGGPHRRDPRASTGPSSR